MIDRVAALVWVAGTGMLAIGVSWLPGSHAAVGIATFGTCLAALGAAMALRRRW